MQPEKPTQLANRALARGLEVVRVLDQQGGLRLADLMRSSNLPKTTLRRLLAVLIEHGFVRRSLGDGRYRSNISWSQLPSTSAGLNTVVFLDAACDVLRELTDEVQWPSDILVRDGTRMRVVESTRALSPLFVTPGRLEVGVDMLRSAAGPAYLAHCKTAERNTVLSAYDLTVDERRKLDDRLAVIRRRGYALRDPDYWGDSVANDRLRAIAKAVCSKETVLGVVNLVWPVGMITETAFADRYAGMLGDAVKLIEQRYEKMVQGDEEVSQSSKHHPRG
ncbi:helix-turn-helix domain-containing protein [Thalassospira australica]|uniref:helix-turn-helix domain-containing protein n=1 Tax=Thalassospira australica TaxID=1528106 RepID=UPI00138E08C7|nr:helix-turn-helix domain-containing protein [Thalassospira australica]